MGGLLADEEQQSVIWVPSWWNQVEIKQRCHPFLSLSYFSCLEAKFVCYWFKSIRAGQNICTAGFRNDNKLAYLHGRKVSKAILAVNVIQRQDLPQAETHMRSYTMKNHVFGRKSKNFKLNHCSPDYWTWLRFFAFNSYISNYAFDEPMRVMALLSLAAVIFIQKLSRKVIIICSAARVSVLSATHVHLPSSWNRRCLPQLHKVADGHTRILFGCTKMKKMRVWSSRPNERLRGRWKMRWVSYLLPSIDSHRWSEGPPVLQTEGWAQPQHYGQTSSQLARWLCLRQA